MKLKCHQRSGVIQIAMVLLSLVMLVGCAGEPELSSISINPDKAVVTIGQTVSFKAQALSKKGEPMPATTIQWVLDSTDKATIDSSGVFMARKPGQVTVKAMAGTIVGSVAVQIQAKKVAMIQIQAEKEKALPGSLIKFQAKLLAQDNGAAGFNAVTLSSDTKGLKLSTEKVDVGEQGDFSFEVTLGSEPGPNIIFVQAGALKEKRVIEGTRIVKLLIRPEKETFEVNQAVEFQAFGLDELGNQRPVKAGWTISGNKAELKKNGEVRMLSPGKAVIVADYKALSLGRPLTIVPGKLAEINLSPEKISLRAGQSVHVKISGKNNYGYPLPVSASWTLSEDLGTIDPDGMFVAKKVGSTSITASQGDISASIPITVAPGFLADIKIELEKTALVAGETVSLTAQGYDAFGNKIPVQPVWSLDQSLGRIDQQKKTLTVYQSGKGDVRAQKGNILKAAHLQVTPAALHRLEIFPANPTVTAGNEIGFQVKGFDRFNNLISAAPQLSLKDKLGNLGGDGVFKALHSGNTVVEARQGDVVATTSLAVVPGKMVKAVLTPEIPVVFKAGEVQEFTVFGLDALGNTVYSKTSWSIYPIDFGTIDTQGVLSGKKSGNGKILVKIQDLKSTETMTLENSVQIQPGEPVNIVITPDKIRLAAGEKRAFSAKIQDKFGNPIKASVTWSLEDEAVGSISQNGMFKPVKSGTWRVTAAVQNIRAHAQAVVLPNEIAYNNVSPAQLSLKAGETQKLEAVSEDRFGNVVPSRVVWKVIPEELGHVNKDNVFVAEKMGEGFLTAVANDISQKIALKISKGPLARININLPDEKIFSGFSLVLQSHGFDAGNNPVQFQPKWSIQPETLGRIDEQGRFTASKAGKGKLTVQSQGVENVMTIEVVAGEGTRINVLNVTPLNIIAGKKIQLDLKAFDAADNPIATPEFYFETENELGTVSMDNQFRSHMAGRGNITVTMAKAQAVIPVNVAVGPVVRVEVQPGMATVDAGSTMAFKAFGYDGEGNRVDVKASWTVIGGLGSVSEAGKFSAHTVGQGYVSCQMAGVAGLSQIQVSPGPVSRIDITPKQLILVAGQTHQFKGVAFDAQGNIVSVDLRWALKPDGSCGSIDSMDGTFSAKNSGKGEISARAGSVQGKVHVIVSPGEVSELTLTSPPLELVSGEQTTLQVSGRDSYGNLVPTDVTWQVIPESMAVVSPSGLITASKAGSGTISAHHGTLSAMVKLTVVPGHLASITIHCPESSLKGGQIYAFEARGFDVGGNPVQFTPQWAVTTHIGTIDGKTGMFKATRVGKGSMEVYHQGILASQDVAVVPGDLSQLFVAPNPVTLKSGTPQTFKVTGVDVIGNSVTVPALTWEVRGEIGFFEKPGVFAAALQGNGKVVAAINGIYAESYITVIAGDPDPGTTRLRAEPPLVRANGQDVAKILVEVRDKHNNPVPDFQVKLVSSRQSDGLEQPGKTDAAGRATGRISSKQSGTSTITALINREAVRDNVVIDFQ